MKALVIYDSMFGNTKKVAQAIASELKAQALHLSQFKPEMLKGVNLFLVGSPIHGWNPSEETIKFLSTLPAKSLQEIKVAAFDTRIKSLMSGNAAKKISSKLINLGGKVLVQPQGFYVTGKEGPLLDGELVKAKNWAKDILKNFSM